MTEEKQNEYMKRLKTEYDNFTSDMFMSLPKQVFEKADIILNMRYAYDYLRSGDVSQQELEYIMTARYPLREIAETQKAMDEVTYFNNPAISTVAEICGKKLFNDEMIEAFPKRVPIRFHRKLSSISEVYKLSMSEQDDKFKIKKVVVLSREQYDHFSMSLIEDCPFIAENKELTGYDAENNCTHCILVKNKDNGEGILVDSSGYDYARYSAYVQDTSELNLRDIPTEDRSKLMGRQRKIAKQHNAPER